MMKLNKRNILNFFGQSRSKASVLLQDKKKTSKAIKDAFEKASANKGALEGVWNKLQLLFSVTKDYSTGRYTEIPKRSIVAIIGGLIYLLMPMDAIPDFIPVFGLVDDIFVLNLVYRQVLKDLEKYEKWKSNQAYLKLNETER